MLKQPRLYLKLVSIPLLFLWVQASLAQERFSKYADVFPEAHESIWTMQLYGDRVFAQIASICDQTIECSGIVELSNEGEIVWEKKNVWLDPGIEGLAMRKDTLLSSGHQFTFEENFIHKLDLNGNSISIDSIKIDELNYRLINHGMTTYKDYDVVYGQLRRTSDSLICGQLSWRNIHTGKDTILQLCPGDRKSAIFDAGVGPDSLLTVLVEYENVSEWLLNQQLIKFDAEMNIVWEQTFTFENDWQPLFASLEFHPNGLMLVKTGNINFPDRDEIWAIDEDGEVLWKHAPSIFELPGPLEFNRALTELLIASNGDIIAVGYIRGTLFNGDVGLITRISPEGELIWERYIQDDVGFGNEMNAGFSDVVELSDGSLMLGGGSRRWHTEDQEIGIRDIWIVRTDAQGCITPGCDDLQDLSDTKIIPQKQSNITIYPNPTTGLVQMEIPLGTNIEEVEVFQMNGQLVSTFLNSTVIDLSALSSGLYLLKIKDQDGYYHVKKLSLL